MIHYLFQIIGKCMQDAKDIKPKDGVDFLLEESDWDDYGYITMYFVHATPHITKRKENYCLGNLRIMKLNQKKGESNLLRKDFLSQKLVFNSLPYEYVSLSLDVDFYENLQQILRKPNERETFASSLNMIFGEDSPLYPIVKEKECFVDSLLRDFYINDFSLLQGQKIMLSKEIVFDLRTESFEVTFSNSGEKLKLDFCALKDFADSETIPNGIIALIGKNGSGKSTALYEIAKILYASPDTRRLIQNKVGRLGNNSIGISKLIMFSYSAFDNFVLPGSTKQECWSLLDGLENHTGRFVFCGIRDVVYDMKELYYKSDKLPEEKFIDIASDYRFKEVHLKSPDKLGEEYVAALESLKNGEKLNLWVGFMKSIREKQPELWSSIKEISDTYYIDKQNYKDYFNKLSTGYKFIIHSMAHLIANCEYNNLVLFDEPENHLQPPLLSFIISEIRKILAKNRSVMLIATHSPIILQEVFAKNVRIVKRFGNSRCFEQPKIETYGESFGAIAAEVFNINSDNTHYYQSIEKLYEAWNMDSVESLQKMIALYEEKLGGSLSSQMESFLISKYAKSHKI